MAYNITISPKVYNIVVPHGYGYGQGNDLDFAPQLAVFVQLTNRGDADVDVKLNNDPDAIFQLESNATQTFNQGELHVTAIDFANTVSGAGSGEVEVIVGLVSI